MQVSRGVGVGWIGKTYIVKPTVQRIKHDRQYCDGRRCCTTTDLWCYYDVILVVTVRCSTVETGKET